MRERTGIYCRVSTKDQKTEQQLQELREYCKRSGIEVVEEYIDEGISAFNKNRPAFQQLIEDVRKRKVNVVVVWKLDRLSRSLKELLQTVELFSEYNVKFVSYSQPIDTSTATGKVFFSLIGAFAEFERDLISERTKLKLDLLKKNGVKLGRPNKVDPAVIYKLRDQCLSIRKIAAQVGCNPSTVSRVLQKGYA
ncbi:recombinase family protein [Patescibacteria group bacterium]|nr:recombinase family protein [Patescibacteria group bacterium]